MRPEDRNGTRLPRLSCGHLAPLATGGRLCSPCAWPGVSARSGEQGQLLRFLGLLPQPDLPQQRLTRYPVLLLERQGAPKTVMRQLDTLIVSVNAPKVRVEVFVPPVCEAVSVFGLELLAFAAITTLPEFCPVSVMVDAWAR